MIKFSVKSFLQRKDRSSFTKVLMSKLATLLPSPTHYPPLICCSQARRDTDHQGCGPGGPHERETQLSEGFLPRETEGDKECDEII